jgi:hypothetical protein
MLDTVCPASPGIRTHVLLIRSETIYQRASEPVVGDRISSGLSTELPPVPFNGVLIVGNRELLRLLWRMCEWHHNGVMGWKMYVLRQVVSVTQLHRWTSQATHIMSGSPM